MLVALLYNHDNQVIAAAPACDQIVMGDQFWIDMHESSLCAAEAFETAYATISNPKLQEQLMLLGIDQAIDGAELTRRVESDADIKFDATRAA